MAKDAPDDRFAQLIKDEYGVAVEGPAVAEDAVHAAAKRQHRSGQRTTPATWFSLDKAIDETEPDYEPWERFSAPAAPPLMRPRNRLVIAALASIVFALVVSVLWLVGVAVPTWCRALGGVAVGAAMLLLLLSIPRHRDPDGDGAVL